MRKGHKAALAGLAMLAVAAPVAQAAPGKGKGQAKKPARVKLATYVVKGVWDADTATVEVRRGNAHARRGGLVGEVIALDLTSSRLSVADTDGDGDHAIADFQDGDRVVVQLTLPRRDPGDGPFAARKLVNQSNPLVEHEDADEESGSAPQQA